VCFEYVHDGPVGLLALQLFEWLNITRSVMASVLDLGESLASACVLYVVRYLTRIALAARMSYHTIRGSQQTRKHERFDQQICLYCGLAYSHAQVIFLDPYLGLDEQLY
jgi:hypothetical protein